MFKKDKKLISELELMVKKNNEKIIELEQKLQDKTNLEIVKDMEDLLYAGCTSSQLIDIFTTCKSLIETDKVNKSACFGVANINNQPAPERVESVPLASDRQIAYMRERGIPTWDNMTKYEAIDEINKWKEANNIPVSENAKYYKK